MYNIFAFNLFQYSFYNRVLNIGFIYSDNILLDTSVIRDSYDGDHQCLSLPQWTVDNAD